VVGPFEDHPQLLTLPEPVSLDHHHGPSSNSTMAGISGGPAGRPGSGRSGTTTQLTRRADPPAATSSRSVPPQSVQTLAWGRL
jgi:hypothetical protein